MNHKIEIIAELGINHLGQNDLLKQMIQTAAECQVDTIKIQLYDPRKVFGDPPREPEKFTQLEWQAIFDARLGRRQVFWIKQECETVGLNFLSSVSDLERLQWLEDVGMDRYKIASDDALNEELCKAIIEKGKPILISDGHLKNKNWPVGKFADWRKVHWLYCISDYPTAFEKLEFIGEFGCDHPDDEIEASIYHLEEYTGFSDHTVGISASVVAMSLGAKIIEKHFTIDRTLPGPDQICSVDSGELRQLCNMRNDIERILYK